MEIKIIKNENFIYKVEEDETLLDICSKFKILESKIIKDNNLNNNVVKQGDLLYIEQVNNNIYFQKIL